MQDSLDWLMRPVVRGMCKYETLKDATFDLCDFAIMNEALDVEDENKMRIMDASPHGRR